MATVSDPYWREREEPNIMGQGSITLIGMTDAECRKAAKRERKRVFGFQAPRPPRKKR